MVAYSFKARFAPKILDGTKGGTIRLERAGIGRHARRGEELQLYTGMRTKSCKLVARHTCAGVSDISLDFKRGRVADQVRLGSGVPFLSTFLRTARQLDAFAVFDGFGDWADMRAFWDETHDALKRFEGAHIRWLEWPEALRT